MTSDRDAMWDAIRTIVARHLHDAKWGPGTSVAPEGVWLARADELLGEAFTEHIPGGISALRQLVGGEMVMVHREHLRVAMSFYPKFDHDTRTRLIGDQLREAAAPAVPDGAVK